MKSIKLTRVLFPIVTPRYDRYPGGNIRKKHAGGGVISDEQMSLSGYQNLESCIQKPIIHLPKFELIIPCVRELQYWKLWFVYMFIYSKHSYMYKV